MCDVFTEIIDDFSDAGWDDEYSCAKVIEYIMLLIKLLNKDLIWLIWCIKMVFLLLSLLFSWYVYKKLVLAKLKWAAIRRNEHRNATVELFLNFYLPKCLPRCEVPENSIGHQCVVCLDNFSKKESVTKLQCGHVFHRECILSWMAVQMKCPMCRYFKFPMTVHCIAVGILFLEEICD